MTNPLMEAFGDDYTHVARRSEFSMKFRYAKSDSERYEALLGFYRALWPAMKSTSTHRWAMDPHEIDWDRIFSPIERTVWADIRLEGIVLYPQHPVAGYFVDFGHPVARVAIECDGNQYHLNKQRDAERQAAIEAKGWKVYRLTGSACSRDDPKEEEDPESGEALYPLGPARELLQKVAQLHRLSPRFVDRQVA